MRNIFPICLLAMLAACNESSGSKSNPSPVVNPPVGSDNGIGAVETPVSKPDTSLPDDDNSTTNPLDSGAYNLGLKNTRSEILSPIGKHLASKAARFESSVTKLKKATEEYCLAPSEAGLSQSQMAWKEVMAEWQYFEVFQVGPVKANAKLAKFNIYSWPNLPNYCKIEEEALKARKSEGYKLPPNYNRKGLAAVEYLLFHDANQSKCAAGSTTAKEWTSPNLEERIQNQCAYLKPLTQELARQSELFQDSWGTPESNYISKIIGDESKTNELIQELYEASFYVDLEVKNQKISGPAGIDTRYCSTSPEPCLETSEFFFSNYSRAALNVNLEAFADLVFGPGVPERKGGLSALLRQEGTPASAEVADRTERLVLELANLSSTDTEAKLSDLVSSFAKENCDLSSNSWICKARSTIRKIFTDFKAEYAAILKVQAPSAAAGDND